MATDEWVAVRGATIDQVAGILELERRDEPDVRGHGIALLPSGWVLVPRDLGDRHLSRMTAAGEGVRFHEQTNAMVTTLVYYREGSVRWSVSVLDEGADPGELASIDGDPDPIVLEMLGAAVARQRNETDAAHVYDAVANIAEKLTGYHSALEDLVWHWFAPPSCAITRAVAIDYDDEQHDPALATVLEAVTAFAANPSGSVSLAVTVEGERRVLRAKLEGGAVKVILIGDGVRVGGRRDDTAITPDELTALFSAFYPEGKPPASYRWAPLSSY